MDQVSILMSLFVFTTICICTWAWVYVRAKTANRNKESTITERILSDSIINSLPGILYFYDRTGKFLKWNKNFESVTGYSSEQIATMVPLNFLDDKEISKQKIESVFSNGVDELETNLLTRDGRKIPYYFNGSRVVFDGVEYLIGMGIDMTERNAARAKAIAASRQNETTLNRIRSAVVSVDIEFKYTFLNDAALTTHPGGRDSVLGKHMLEVHPEMNGSVFWETYQRAMKTMQVQEVENYYQPMDTWFSVKAYPSEDGLTIFYDDITVRKKSEKQLLDLIASLEAKNKDLNQFSYIVSHNLRAPIAKITGLTSIIETESEKNKMLIGLITQETKSLDDVVRDMSTIVYARKSDPEMYENINIQNQLDQITQQLAMQIAETGAIIKSDFSAVKEIITIKPYFHSIVFNLISNAAKFRKADTAPIIEVSTQKLSDSVCLSVKDNGVGIDLESNRDKMFRLYKRFHDDFPGRGMGLSMVKTQVESLGGRIEVTSVVGEGSQFKIYLPLKLNYNVDR